MMDLIKANGKKRSGKKTVSASFTVLIENDGNIC